MKHKIATMCVTVLVIGLLVLAGATLLQAGPPPKVTGGVGFTRTNDAGEDVACWAEFEARAISDTLAKGWIKYHDADGLQFRVEVQCLTVLGDSALFSGPIISSTDTMLIGQFLLVGVYDGGTPGSKGDLIWGEFYPRDPGCWQSPPSDPASVDKGNLVVH